MWLCDLENCNKVSIRTYGECVLCKRHLCAKNLGPEYHTYPKREEEAEYDSAARKAERDKIIKLVDKINISAPRLFGEASLIPYHTICSMIDQHEAQL
ncbi:hypothetical protein N7492_002614 [Penicillium capsulatum]|uniref:Uncharacterized protein n=1 Tax=Penicillium capsulatum TaxID=69766 RepID=A0A9W9IKD2_9EURO|nr:hypothetical protein N7492_002614 [Penicillium capsulatum]